MFTDIANRVYNHSFKIDPIIRSLLDIDFYKFTTLQLVWQRYNNVNITFELRNRTKSVKLAHCINIAELRNQLDHARSLRFTKSELIWLAGNTFYGKKGIFEPQFIEFLRNYSLPEYNLEIVNGEIVLTFSGPWVDVSLWEIYALAIVNELRVRNSLTKMSRSELDIMYARAKTRIYDHLQSINMLPNLTISDFGTRRRHGFLWQEWVIQTARDVLGSKFIGTSNAYLAMKHDMENLGSMPHELFSTIATLAETDDELKQAQYKVLVDWQNTYNGNMLVALPDTFGTTQFLKDAPEFLKDWRGFRVDSKSPIEAGYEFINWWQHHGVDPKSKLIIFSDGLDVDNIHQIYNEFDGKATITFGWGTNLTNNFKGLHPSGGTELDAISLVCKVVEANGKSAVKLSDNAEKVVGTPEVVEHYRSVFGYAGVKNRPLVV